jgi:hypothetical protein
MKAAVYIAALLLGVLIGAELFHTADHFSGGRIGPGDSRAAANGRSTRPPESVGVRIGRLISAESPAMEEGVPVEMALDVLHTERKSPLRTRAFLKSRIQMMTAEQLIRSLANGEVQSQSELAEVARRLAKEDPQGTFTRWEAQELKVYGMENIYTFVDSLLQTWGDTDAIAVMERLKKMKRGGSQQDFSLRFSGYWAKIDPAAAARNFSDLVYLRNMHDQGDLVFTDNTFAGDIVKSWKQQDEQAMREYIGSLSNGRERDALENAVKKLDEPKR